MKPIASGVCALVAVVIPATSFAADNPVVRENRRPGTTEWLLKNHKDFKPGTDAWRREKAIEGYCSHASIRPGETLTVFVSTDPATRYTIDFYRMGYYGGKGGRHVLKKGPLDGEPQPTPKDGKNALIECQWKPAVSFEIPKDWVSGVYLGKLTAEDSEAESYVIFIVRDDRKADLLFQCSDLTWQSYNRWPAWRSLYDFGDEQVAHQQGQRRRVRPALRGLLQRPARPHPADHQRVGRVPAVGVPARLLAGAGGVRRDLRLEPRHARRPEGAAAGQGVPVGRARRVLDAADVRQPEPGPRRGAGHRVPVRQLGVRGDRTQAVDGRAAGPGVRADSSGSTTRPS